MSHSMSQTTVLKVYYCKACFVIIRDTGKERPELARENVGRGIHKALENGRIFGKKKYSLLDSIFDTVTEQSAYWRGVFDGDGYLKNKDGKEGDRMVLTGSNDLLKQFEDFIRKNIPNSEVTIRKIRGYSKLYVYSDTARALSKLMYCDCRIALKRKLAKASKMYYEEIMD